MATTSKPPTIAHIKQTPTLWYKLHILLLDLHTFKDRPDSRARLECITDMHYIGSPYFTPSESTLLKSLDISPLSKLRLGAYIASEIREKLEARSEKGGRGGKADFEICTSHDIAPIFEEVMGVRAREVGRNKVFLKCVRKYGLGIDGAKVDVGGMI